MLHEEMEIISSDNPEKIISFKSGKLLSLNMDCLKQPIDWFNAAIDEWISRIEVNREKFTSHFIPSRDNTHGEVEIRFNGKTLANLILEKSHFINSDGKKSLRASLQLRFLRFEDEILDNCPAQTVYFNDVTFSPTHVSKGNIPSFLEVLNEIIPTRSEAIINAIAYVFQITPEDIVLDSFRKKYIITAPYIFRNWTKQEHPNRFYKYVSLQTYHNMLNYKSFRMNSIGCQSDETESWYFANFLCEEYENEKDKLRYILKESNTLISSFTTSSNDSKMWEEYGDKGNGVMLGFEPLDSDILSPVLYIDEESDSLGLLKENIKEFKKNNIHLYFSEIDRLHRFLKNKKYEFEKEWRLVYEFCGKLDYAVYHDSKNDVNTYAEFHDFPFQGNIIPDLKIALVSVKFGQKNRYSNISLLTRRTVECFGENIVEP